MRSGRSVLKINACCEGKKNMTEEKKRPKFVLVDGSNYLFRAFYAIRRLSNSKGFPTNATYGFTTMLTKLLRDQEPDYIAVAFDAKGPTFRHDGAYDAYKATRKGHSRHVDPVDPVRQGDRLGFSIPVLVAAGSGGGRHHRNDRPPGRRRRGMARSSSSPGTRT